MIALTTGGTTEITIKARAKINIGLRIGGRREDGYHAIWSILQEIDLCDQITLREAADLSLSILGDHAELPGDQTNLCLRAASLLKQETGYRQGAHIVLRKNIPVGAGLGGGSADAAAVLKGLNRLWRLKLSRATLLKLAANLGSDVPFFILGGCCVATGRGEILKKIDPVVVDPLLLLAPWISISTSWAYKNIENNRLTWKPQIINFNDLKKATFSEVLSNEFEPLVFSRYPVLKDLKRQLLHQGAYYASLSGSGSSLYGVFPSELSARRAEDEIRVEGQKYLLK